MNTHCTVHKRSSRKKGYVVKGRVSHRSKVTKQSKRKTTRRCEKVRVRSRSIVRKHRKRGGDINNVKVDIPIVRSLAAGSTSEIATLSIENKQVKQVVVIIPPKTYTINSVKIDTIRCKCFTTDRDIIRIYSAKNPQTYNEIIQFLYKNDDVLNILETSGIIDEVLNILETTQLLKLKLITIRNYTPSYTQFHETTPATGIYLLITPPNEFVYLSITHNICYVSWKPYIAFRIQEMGSRAPDRLINFIQRVPPRVTIYLDDFLKKDTVTENSLLIEKILRLAHAKETDDVTQLLQTLKVNEDEVYTSYYGIFSQIVSKHHAVMFKQLSLKNKDSFIQQLKRRNKYKIFKDDIILDMSVKIADCLYDIQRHNDDIKKLRERTDTLRSTVNQLDKFQNIVSSYDKANDKEKRGKFANDIIDAAANFDILHKQDFNAPSITSITW